MGRSASAAICTLPMSVLPAMERRTGPHRARVHALALRLRAYTLAGLHQSGRTQNPPNDDATTSAGHRQHNADVSRDDPDGNRVRRAGAADHSQQGPRRPKTASVSRGRSWVARERQPLAAVFGLWQRLGARYFAQRHGSRVSI
jgi:hypothetical protein